MGASVSFKTMYYVTKSILNYHTLPAHRIFLRSDIKTYQTFLNILKKLSKAKYLKLKKKGRRYYITLNDNFYELYKHIKKIYKILYEVDKNEN